MPLASRDRQERLEPPVLGDNLAPKEHKDQMETKVYQAGLANQ